MFCVSCGVTLVPGARFCSACGQRQSEAPAATAAATSAMELRQITALCCELVGALRDVPASLMDAFRHQMVEVLNRLGGRVIQVKPLSTLVYFGYPVAHENDPERATLAALEIRDVALPELNHQLARSGLPHIQARLAVHTGMAVLNGAQEPDGSESFAVGDAPNVVSRLPGVAMAPDVMVTLSTRRLLKGSYEWTPEQEVNLRGLDEPLLVQGAIRVLRSAGFTALGSDLPPMSGRATELAGLQAQWRIRCESAAAHHPVAVIAEPGMGKSLLLAHFAREVLQAGGTVHRVECAAYQSSTAWYPFVVWMEAVLGMHPADDVDTRLSKLRAGLPVNLAADALGLVAHALSVPCPEATALTHLAPAVLKARAEAVVSEWLAGSAEGRPVPVLVVEDVHWADPSTLEFFRVLATKRLFVVLTHRPDYKPPAHLSGDAVRPIRLKELQGALGQRVAMSVTGGKPLPDDLMATILAATDGNPFFIAEYTRAVLDSGRLVEHPDRFELVGDVPASLIPGSLRDSLAARLDRLGSVRGIARHAAVIGRRFERGLLAVVAPDGSAEVDRGVSVLLGAGLIRAVDGPGDTFEFQHALIQVAAYESMLRQEREAIHAKVAERLDVHFPKLAQAQPELVARHLTESRQWVPAIQRWLQAAMRSLGNCSYAETLAQVAEGQALLRHIAPAEAAGLELALLSIQGPALIATTGFGSDQVGEIYTRTQALCTSIGDRPETFPSLWGNWVYNLVRGNLDVSQAYSRRMWAMGEALGASAMQVEAAWTHGNASFWKGNLAEAEFWLRKAVALYDMSTHSAHAVHFGQDPGVAARCYLSLTLVYQGRLKEGRAEWIEGHRLAERLNHPFSMAWILAFDFMDTLPIDVLHALEASQKTLDFCYAQGTPFWIASSHVVHGWASSQLVDSAAGLEELRMGLQMYQSTGSLLVQATWFSKLAECLVDAGRFDEAEEALEEGMARARQTGEHLASVQLALAKSRVLVARGEHQQAVAVLNQALDVADACRAGWLAMLVSSALVELRPDQVTYRERLSKDVASIDGGRGYSAWEKARTLLVG